MIKPNIYKLLISIIQHQSFACTQAVEVDYHEYAACEKCYNCLTRKKLKKPGSKNFNICGTEL